MRLVAWIVVALLGLLALFWLSQTYRGRPFVAEFVEDQGRSNRIELIRVPVGFSFNGSQGFDFHSVVWKTNNGTSWELKKAITAREFQTNGPNPLWVFQLHSIDGASGTAVLKMAG